MDLRQLRYFVAAVESKSIAAAAKKMGLSQSTLTRAIHDLESSIGISLLVRETDGVRPTTRGREFYERAKMVLEQLTLLEESVKRAPEGRATLSFGYPVSSYLTTISSVTDSLKSEFPSLLIKFLKRSGFENSLELLRSERPSVATLFLGGRAKPPDIELVEFVKFHDYVAMPTTHKLSSLDVVSLADLAGERIGLAGYFQEFTSPADRVHRDYSRAGVQVCNFDKSFSMDDLLSQLPLGGGLVWIPSTMVIPVRKVKYVKVGDVPGSQVHLATLKNVNSEIAERFLELCKAFSPEIQRAMDELVTAANSNSV